MYRDGKSLSSTLYGRGVWSVCGFTVVASGDTDFGGPGLVAALGFFVALGPLGLGVALGLPITGSARSGSPRETAVAAGAATAAVGGLTVDSRVNSGLGLELNDLKGRGGREAGAGMGNADRVGIENWMACECNID